MIFAVAAIAVAEEKDPTAEISTAIPYAIKLLEGKQYEKFIKELANPAEVKRMEKEDGGLTKAAQDWGKDFGPFTLKVLQEFKEQKPTVSADGTRATFKSTKTADGGEIAFRKTGKFWHLEE